LWDSWNAGLRRDSLICRLECGSGIESIKW
jgi:hypothetical protein